MPPSWAKNLTQGFGPTSEVLDGPYAGYAHFNKGYDYGLPEGTPIEFNVGGTVVGVSEDPNNSTGWGKYVWIQDSAGNIHRYNHLSMVGGWDVGDSVSPNQLAGKVGSTGHSTGPHLSYDVTDASGAFIDPGQFIDGSNTSYSGGAMASSPEVLAAFRRWSDHTGKLNVWTQQNAAGGTDPYPFTAEQEAEFARDDLIVGAWLDELGQGGSGTTVDDILRQYEFWDETDPALIDATNTANKYARELEQRNLAAEISTKLLTEQNEMQQAAVESRQKQFFTDPNSGNMIRQPGGSLIPQLKVPTGDELFSQSLAKIKENLPEVTDIPYRTRPAGSPGSFAGVGAGGTNSSMASILAEIGKASGTTKVLDTPGLGSNPVQTRVGSRALDAEGLGIERYNIPNGPTTPATGAPIPPGPLQPVQGVPISQRHIPQTIPTPGQILNKPADRGASTSVFSGLKRGLSGSIFGKGFR